MQSPRYKADIAGGTLMIPESRIVARLLLDHTSESAWNDAIRVRNVLQKRSPGTASRQASLIRLRLQTMSPEVWGIIASGREPACTHAVFACAVKHSALLGDFLDLVVRDRFRTFKPDLPRSLWDRYLEGCRDRDPQMPEWMPSTAAKLGDTVYRILAEVGYVSAGRGNPIQPIRVAPEVVAALREGGEDEVIARMQVS